MGPRVLRVLPVSPVPPVPQALPALPERPVWPGPLDLQERRASPDSAGNRGCQVGRVRRESAARWESFKDILFDFDRSNVRTDERDTIKQIVQFMKEHPTFEVGLEGYADPRGTDGYNQALSERRVKAIRDALVASGAAKDGIRIGAEGEKHRNCGEETEGCFQKNRRVEVFVRPDARAAAR